MRPKFCSTFMVFENQDISRPPSLFLFTLSVLDRFFKAEQGVALTRGSLLASSESSQATIRGAAASSRPD